MTYRGIVRGNTIVLERPTGLPDGTRVIVDIRPAEPVAPSRSELHSKQSDESRDAAQPAHKPAPGTSGVVSRSELPE